MSQKPSGTNQSMRSKAPHGPKEDKVPTYQELLDESLEETFPASDPIAPGAAAHPSRPVATDKDERDWKLEPGADRQAMEDRAGSKGREASEEAQSREGNQADKSGDRAR